MLRKFLLFFMALTLVWTTLACSDSSSTGSIYSTPPQQSRETSSTDRLPDGKYPLQQAAYNDIDGEYTLMLLNTAPGQSSTFRTTDLPMARLTDEETESGQKSYLAVEQGQPSLHLTEDFRIEYVHNVTETQVNPQTGQSEVTVIRQEPSFWTPFAGALAGQALGSLLFAPHYYFPPVYQPGIALTGFGGYGRTYSQAVQNYQARYNSAPAEVRNQRLRTSGQLRSPSSRFSRSPSTRTQADRSTGSGYGSSTLRRSDYPTRSRARSSSGFGSSRARSFSGRRR